MDDRKEDRTDFKAGEVSKRAAPPGAADPETSKERPRAPTLTDRLLDRWHPQLKKIEAALDRWAATGQSQIDQMEKLQNRARLELSQHRVRQQLKKARDAVQAQATLLVPS